MVEDVPMLKEIIKRDTEFCCYHELMDYSLLFAVEKFSARSLSQNRFSMKDVLLAGMGKNKVEQKTSINDDLDKILTR